MKALGYFAVVTGKGTSWRTWTFLGVLLNDVSEIHCVSGFCFPFLGSSSSESIDSIKDYEEDFFRNSRLLRWVTLSQLFGWACLHNARCKLHIYYTHIILISSYHFLYCKRLFQGAGPHKKVTWLYHVSLLYLYEKLNILNRKGLKFFLECLYIEEKGFSFHTRYNFLPTFYQQLDVILYSEGELFCFCYLYSQCAYSFQTFAHGVFWLRTY